VKLPAAFHENGLARFSGKLDGRLPDIVEQQFQSKGLKIALDYVVLNWIRIHANKAPTLVLYETPIVIGGIIGVIGGIFGVLFIVFWIFKKKR
jgi:hypothetical protein